MNLCPSFIRFMDEHFLDVSCDLAVAVSGGGDSMALAAMLLEWRKVRKQGFSLHILSVDHGFREEVAAELDLVTRNFADSDGVQHRIFKVKWEEGKPQSAIMKQARQARYELMQEYCRAQGIKHLFLAHHRDDQAETFLIRLAKGSGVDGLAGMRAIQAYDDEGLHLVRPLLHQTHQQLLDYCQNKGIEWAEDPTNENLSYTRNRLRASRVILEEEGLSALRLGRVSERCARVRDALEFYTQQALEDIVVEKANEVLKINFDACLSYPLEIVMRVFLFAYDHLCHEKYYRPRFEKLENIVFQILQDRADFKGRTLGGLHIFVKKGLLIFQREAD
jgi:tRNA(Ile)-lysidine synthase